MAWGFFRLEDTDRLYSISHGGFVPDDGRPAASVKNEDALVGLLKSLHLPAPATIADVRTEASRRMQLFVGARDQLHLDIIISNGNREAIRLLRKGEANWTADDQLRDAQLSGADAMLEAIRAASNSLEQMTEIPADYADDKWWPNAG